MFVLRHQPRLEGLLAHPGLGSAQVLHVQAQDVAWVLGGDQRGLGQSSKPPRSMIRFENILEKVRAYQPDGNLDLLRLLVRPLPGGPPT